MSNGITLVGSYNVTKSGLGRQVQNKAHLVDHERSQIKVGSHADCGLSDVKLGIRYDQRSNVHARTVIPCS